MIDLRHGDCLDILATLPDASVDAVVTDPPYGLANTDPAHVAETITRWVNGERDYLPGGAGFMGKAWDAFVPPVAVWDDCLRVLKPGGHVLAFAGSRTVDLMTLGLRLAGFDIRDSIAWLYGSGFPKSLDVSKAIDRARDDRDAILAVTSFMADHAERQGVTRAAVDAHMGTSDMGGWWLSRLRHRCACPTLEQYARLKALLSLPDDLDAEVWRLNGRKGTPGEAWEQREVTGSANVPVGHAFAGSTYGGDSSGRVVDITAPATDAARTWQGWGTALKPAFEPVVVARKPLSGTVAQTVLAHGTGALNIDGCRVGDEERTREMSSAPGGNGIRLTGGDGRDAENARAYAERSKTLPPKTVVGRWPANVVLDEPQAEVLDQQSGESASKPHSGGRGGTSALNQRASSVFGEDAVRAGSAHDDQGGASRFFYIAKADASERVRVNGIAHPTVKPLALMRWLVRLVTPPGGTVLEPFAGSGTTVEACILEGFSCIAIEREADYLPLIRQRIARRRDPVEAVRAAGEDRGLFDLLDDGGAA